MSTRTVNLGLAVTLVVLFGMNWMVGVDPSRPNVEFWPEMVRSVPSDSFSPSAVFADGKTLQAAVPGTIQRGLLPLHYGATPEEAIRAGAELANPFSPDDEAAIERGAFVYENFCQPCHGESGRGDGPVASRGVPPPTSLLPEKARSMRDGQLFHILTYGQGNMPSYAVQISREDRWKVIVHVRRLQREAETLVTDPAPPPGPETPAEPLRAQAAP